jgi:hypothetical protein
MTDLRAKYFSKRLFPLFANRILAESRPEYERYLSWMGLHDGVANPLDILARTGGIRATDSLQIYVCPEKNLEGKYETHFFCHGIRHLSGIVANYVLGLKQGDALYPMLDVLNPFDAQAVALRTADPAMMIGYTPRYLARDVARLAALSKDNFEAEIERVNAEAPIQYRLLCRLTAEWPENFSACSDSVFESLYNHAEGPQKDVVVNS